MFKRVLKLDIPFSSYQQRILIIKLMIKFCVNVFKFLFLKW